MNSFITKKDKLVILNSIFPQTKYGPTYGPYFFSAFSTPNLFYNNFIFLRITTRVDQGSYGVMAITLDFESNNPSSNLGRTSYFCGKIGKFRLKSSRFFETCSIK